MKPTKTYPSVDSIEFPDDGTAIVHGVRGPLRPRITKDGYERVKVKKYGKWKWESVHRIVATFYCSGYEEGKQVNHIDGNKTHNNPSNLEWVTQLQNLHHAMRNGTHNWGMSPVERYNHQTAYGVWYPSMRAAEAEGYQQPNIWKVVNGERGVHKGYTWR